MGNPPGELSTSGSPDINKERVLLHFHPEPEIQNFQIILSILPAQWNLFIPFHRGLYWILK
jgi:hypothetical protein